jgi:DNA helicase-2/ATP-dependent DNA helicase PcrA
LLKQQAVLFRTSNHSGPLEIELTRRNIPFVKFGGFKFLEAAHIEDMLALLRFVENPRDRVAGFRLMQLMPGVGPTSARRVLDFIVEAPDPISELTNAPVPPRAEGDEWRDFVATVGDLHAGRAGWPAELERARLMRSGSTRESSLKICGRDPAANWWTLAALRDLARQRRSNLFEF